MECIDFTEAGVNTNCPLKQNDQHSNEESGNIFNDNGHGFQAVFMGGPPSPQQKTAQVIAIRGLGVNLNGLSSAIFQDFDENHEKVVKTLSEVLTVGL